MCYPPCGWSAPAERAIQPQGPYRISRAMRPLAPEAQQEPSGAHCTASNVPVSNGRQLRPPSVLTSLPVGPTASAVRQVCGTQAAPERYAFGRCAAPPLRQQMWAPLGRR